MNKYIKRIYDWMVIYGFNPRVTMFAIQQMPRFRREYKELRKQEPTARKKFPFGPSYPYLSDKHAQSGSAKGAYFHQDLLVARRIFENAPADHLDVGSRIDGFVAHVASFRTIKVMDIRPQTTSVRNIEFIQADLMEPITGDLLECCSSLSCLHTIEHFGLGRYGDKIDYDGYLRGLDNLYRLLKKGGTFYFSCPIGPLTIEFNGKRILSVEYLLELFDQKYRIDHFSFVDDHGDLHENAELTAASISDNFGCKDGCGIFEMTKL